MKTLPQSTLSGLHPLVGHAYSSADAGFLLDNETISNGLIEIKLGNPNGPKILISGGSTSDIFYDGSWVRPFSKFLFGACSSIFSCACVGYSTSQELFRLLESVAVIKPDCIISLNGINDIKLMQSRLYKYPYIHKYQHSLFDVLGSMQNLNYLSRAVADDSSADRQVLALECVNDKYGFDTWFLNVSLMSHICDFYGARFYSFLQPCLGFAPYVPSPDSLEGYYWSTLIRSKTWYESGVNSFYKKAVEACLDSSFLYDFTSILGPSCEGVFQDTRHLNSTGNFILAKSIYAILCSSGFF